MPAFTPRDLGCRAAGLSLLAGCAVASRWLALSAHRPPGHAVSAIELLAAALAAATLGCGLALLFEGAGLFELIPVPQRHWYRGI